MDIHKVIFFILLTISGSSLASEPEILRQFFGGEGVKDKVGLYHGEMLEHYSDKPTLGENLPDNVMPSYRKLEEIRNKAVYAVRLSDGKITQDWYAYLVNENKKWKLSGARRLSLSGLIYELLRELEGKSDRTEEEEWAYQNALLTLKSDVGLKAYLKENIKEFEKVVDLHRSVNESRSGVIARQLFISFVKEVSGIIELNIGGIIDNSVGYLFVPPGKSPPEMSLDKYIYIEEVLQNWYVYKTT